MKKIVMFLSAALLLAACSKNKGGNVESLEPAEGVIPVAVVNADSIFSQYTLAVELRESLVKKQEDARLKVNEKSRKLQTEMAEFQRKYENNAFISQASAEQQYRRLQQRQAELEQMDQKLSQEIMELQQAYNEQLRDSIDEAIKALNAEGKFQLVLTTSALNESVLYASPNLDITEQVIEYLNDNYEAK